MEINVFLCASIVPNGKLPKDYNTLCLEIESMEVIPNTRKPKNWALNIHGIYGSEVIKATKETKRIYVENNSELLLELVEDPGEYSPFDL